MDAEVPPCSLLDLKDPVRISAWHTRGIEEAGLPFNSLTHVHTLGDVFLIYRATTRNLETVVAQSANIPG